jgi:hypothetical protein
MPVKLIAAFFLGIFLGVNLTLYSVWWQSGAGE